MKVRIAIAAAVVLALFSALLAVLVTRFDPVSAGDYVRDYVRERYGRELLFQGAMSLTLWPILSISVPRATLSEVGSDREAARLERANAEIAWLPLLRGRVIVERIRVSGLHMIIEQRADGSRNIDNLIAPLAATPDTAPGDEPPVKAPRIEIGKVELTEASLAYSDPATGRTVWLDDIELKLDELESRMVTPVSLRARVVASPEGISALLRISGTLDVDPVKRTAGLRGVEASVRGFSNGKPLDANARARRIAVTLGRPGLVGRIESFAIGIKAGGPAWSLDTAHARGTSLDYDDTRLTFAAIGVEASARGRLHGEALEASLAMPEVAITGQSSRGKPIELAGRWRGERDLDLKVTLDGLSGGAQNLSASRVMLSAETTPGALHYSFKATGALRADLDSASVNLAQVSGTITLGPDGSQPALKLPVSGSVHTEISARTLDADFETRFESSLIKFRTRFDPSRPEGRLAIVSSADQLNVDRVIAVLSALDSARKPPPPVRDTASPALASSNASPPVSPPPGTSGPARTLLAGNSWTADFQIGRLKADWLRAAAVAGTLSSTESGLRLSSFSMALHGGTLTGRSDYDRHTHAFTLAARARAIDSGSLLEALARTRRFEGAVEGRAELSGSLQNGDIAESLRGEVSLSIADGRLHGIDLARVVRDQARALRALRDRDSRRRSPEDTEALHGPASDITEFTRLGASFLIGEGQARSRNLLIETPLLKVNGSGVIDLGELAIDASLRVGLKAPGNDPLLTALSRLSLPIQVQGPLKHPNWQVDAAALLPQRPRR